MNQPRKANGQFACKPKMPGWVAMWVAALRSGLYQQGKKYLNSHNKYCCLGVLCEIVPGVAKKQDEYCPALYRYGEKECSDSLPNELKEQLNFKNAYGLFEGVEEFRYSTALAAANDRGATFDEIADFIEKNWPALLKKE